MGTLDQLVGLSDDLGKLDSYVDSVTHKVANYLGEVLEDNRDKLHENLTANNGVYIKKDVTNFTSNCIRKTKKYKCKKGIFF